MNLGVMTSLGISSVLVSAGDFEDEEKSTMLLGSSSGLITSLGMAESIDKNDKVTKTANVIDYLEAYNENQRNELIDQIDGILEEKTNTLKLTKKL